MQRHGSLGLRSGNVGTLVGSQLVAEASASAAGVFLLRFQGTGCQGSACADLVVPLLAVLAPAPCLDHCVHRTSFDSLR